MHCSSLFFLAQIRADGHLGLAQHRPHQQRRDHRDQLHRRYGGNAIDNAIEYVFANSGKAIEAFSAAMQAGIERQPD